MLDPARQQALTEILDMIIKSGLLSSLEMPDSESGDLVAGLAEKNEVPDLEAPMEEEMGMEEEMDEEPVSLSITQLGAMGEPKEAALKEVKQMIKGKGKKRRGK